jgi:hypothetical protein
MFMLLFLVAGALLLLDAEAAAAPIAAAPPGLLKGVLCSGDSAGGHGAEGAEKDKQFSIELHDGSIS